MHQIQTFGTHTSGEYPHTYQHIQNAQTAPNRPREDSAFGAKWLQIPKSTPLPAQGSGLLLPGHAISFTSHHPAPMPAEPLHSTPRSPFPPHQASRHLSYPPDMYAISPAVRFLENGSRTEGFQKRPRKADPINLICRKTEKNHSGCNQTRSRVETFEE